jgi:metallopeptidase MepB
MLRYASSDQAAREVFEKTWGFGVSLLLSSQQGKNFCFLVKAVKDKAEKLGLEATKNLETEWKDFRRCGNGLVTGDQITSYLNTRNEIENLRRKFVRNIRDENEGLWVSLDELDGLYAEDISHF